jgi:SMC interacting uncharacterized protein involved in chromosome segregation
MPVNAMKYEILTVAVAKNCVFVVRATTQERKVIQWLRGKSGRKFDRKKYQKSFSSNITFFLKAHSFSTPGNLNILTTGTSREEP